MSVHDEKTYSVYDGDTGDILGPWASPELVEASLAEDTGLVSARLDGDTWQLVYASDAKRLRDLRETVVTVYVHED